MVDLGEGGFSSVILAVEASGSLVFIVSVSVSIGSVQSNTGGDADEDGTEPLTESFTKSTAGFFVEVSFFSVSRFTPESFSRFSLDSVDAGVTDSFVEGEGEPFFSTSSSIFFSSKFREWNGDVGEVGVSSFAFGLCEDAGEGDRFRERKGAGELKEAGDAGDVARGEFESEALFCSLSPTFCPSSLCVPFIRGGEDVSDKPGAVVNKVL